jgi:hypothetical protein
MTQQDSQIKEKNILDHKGKNLDELKGALQPQLTNRELMQKE